MKRLFSFIMVALMSVTVAFAQADKIVGQYKAVQNGVTSKVKIFKNGNGYRAQVTWVDNLKMKDGSIRTDEKNPDKAKRSVRADQIVLVENVTYNAEDKTWENGKIYDPTEGKTYKTVISFKDDKTLQIKGFLGPFHKSVYWTKLD